MKPLELELALSYCHAARRAMTRIGQVAGAPAVDDEVALVNSRLRELERLLARQVPSTTAKEGVTAEPFSCKPGAGRADRETVPRPAPISLPTVEGLP